MPTNYQRTYRKAAKKKIVLAAMNSFCLACAGYLHAEITATVSKRQGVSVVGIPDLRRFRGGSYKALFGNRLNEYGFRCTGAGAGQIR